jgi:sulfite reductase (NADPH) flavoprotein alpha-component
MATYNLKNPCIAHLSKAELLTKQGSAKDTRHYEIDLMGSGMEFLPGDSLAVKPTNCPDLVEEILAALKLDGDAMVMSPTKEEKSLRETLTNDCAITAPDKKFLKLLAEKAGAGASEWAGLLEIEKKAELADYLWGKELFDFLLAHPAVQFEAQEFVITLKKLLIRLYSIASSLKAYPDEVHLTVATVTYESFGKKRKGVCSTFLSDRIDASTPIPTFINAGKGFRLPEPDDATPIIMVGPGTGIAPFRAFMQERKATNAKGKAWLFFGDQTRANDYLYEDEWEVYQKDGFLHKLDLAFSRDQEHKIYVQTRMKERAADFWAWLEEGAIMYVCGDASRMAKDVNTALHEIIAEEGGKSAEEVAAYVEQMKADKRYRRDVY